MLQDENFFVIGLDLKLKMISLVYYMQRFSFTQCDQAREGFFQTPEQMDAYCKEKGFIGWFEVSAMENINVDDGAKFLLNKV